MNQLALLIIYFYIEADTTDGVVIHIEVIDTTPTVLKYKMF
jgi:hypothetical protein